MTIYQAIILGIVQGATEFLPISSSGHLVIVTHAFGWRLPAQEAFIFDVLVQLGTLVAVIVYFWSDLLAILQSMCKGLRLRQPFTPAQARLGWYIILATVPAVVLGWLFKQLVEQAFANITVTSLFLLGTAVLLLLAEQRGSRTRALENVTWVDALWIGFFQALALFPGVSRSGATITGGMLRDLERPVAARFSFLMAIPVMLAAALLAFLDLRLVPDLMAFLPTLLVGFLVSALVGYFAIRWLLRYLSQHPLYVFSIYLATISLASLLLYA